KKYGASSSQIVDLEAGTSPPPKGGRVFRNRLTTVQSGGESAYEGLSEGMTDTGPKGVVSEVVKDAGSRMVTEEIVPPPVAAESGGDSSAWDSSFDPLAFVQHNILMSGDST
ncbi:hypothetical protein A2U01_0046540, partial [Trifolium medium]|nr:hypothetical protein [Trifolium medium]